MGIKTAEFIAKLGLLLWTINAAYVLFYTQYNVDGLIVLKIFNFIIPTFLSVLCYFGMLNEHDK